MIDYFFKFNTEQDAITAASCAKELGDFKIVGPSTVAVWQWNKDFVLPNVQAWRISQDSTTIPPVHTFLTGWFALAARPNIIQAYLNSSALAFALNRDGPPYVVQNNIGAIMQDVNCQPIFAGSHYPIGGWSSS